MVKTLGVFSAMLVFFGTTSVFGQSLPGDALCARDMINAMRNCSTFIPQPTPTFEKVEKPSGVASNKVTKTTKGSNTTQGYDEPIEMSCRMSAFLDFEDCIYNQQVPGMVEKKKPTTVKATNTKAIAPSAPDNK